MSMSIVPTDNDVLFGRGPVVNAHPGNVKLRVTAAPHKRRFQDSTKRAEKQAIANDILDECHKSGGRFLMEDPIHMAGGDDEAKHTKVPLRERRWVVADRDRATKKVNHILREKEKGGGAGAHDELQPIPREEEESAVSLELQPVPREGVASAVSLQNDLALRSIASSLGGGNIDPLNSLGGGGMAGAFPLTNHLLGGIPSGTIAQQPPIVNPLGAASYFNQPVSARGDLRRESVVAGPLGQPSPSDYSAGGFGGAAETALDASLAGPPIGICDWKNAAREVTTKNAYILGAVELAWMLAKHLNDLIGSGAKVNVQEINPDGVLVFLEHPLPHRDNDDSRRNLPVIREVQLKTSLFGAECAVAEPSDACAALGRIFVDVFGFDRTCFLDATLQSDHDSNDGMPLAPKRQATMPSNLAAQAMPSPISRLVSDLLYVGDEQQRPSNDEQNHRSGIASLEEALWELGQMRSNPESFLFEQTCPEKALDNFYCLDENLFGREKELAALMEAKKNVAIFVDANSNTASSVGSGFLCEVAFVGGYAGSGKSTLLLPLIEACVEEQWFVLGCKFDKQAAPIKVLFKMFDVFFGKWGELDGADVDSSSPMVESFRKVCGRIIATIDDDGFDQLADLVPNFTRLFPLVAKRDNSPDHVGISSMDKVGSAQNRLQKLIHVLVESICSAGRPVLFTADDLQWSDSFVVDGMTDLVVNYFHDTRSGASCRRGLFLAGTYRSNEVQEDGSLVESINAIKECRQANVTMLTTGELSKADVTKLISAKLCLPRRYTRALAEVVQTKTRGNPFFVIQFLRTIVSNKMLEFSVRSRRWIWDCDVVEMQMISDGVAGLLAASFNQLPSQLTKTMKIVSCLGYQVERPTIEALDSTKKVLPFCMLDQMEVAVKEGILERAGPVYQFTHDILHQTIYDLIPSDSPGPLHKTIGQNLLKSAADNPTIHLLAADQINMFCKDVTPSSPEERSQIASCNAKAAKFAIADYSFERARSYIDMGIRLLEPNHWEAQYPLSLELYEMSASVSCISGDISTMSTCLTAVLSHVMAFEDSLKASSMLVKLLASYSKYDDARSNCLDILKKLGEEFPSEVSLPLVQMELPELLIILRNITHDQIKALPAMADERKLNAMKFLNMLCMICMVSKPLLLPFLSRRMVQLTLEHGSCEDSIVGLATAGFSVYFFTEDLQLAFRLGRVSESLVEKSPKKHILRARLCMNLYVTLKMLREPWPSVMTLLPELYNSAMLAGDVENALICRWNHLSVGYWLGAMRLPTVSEQSLLFVKEASKYQQNMVLYGIMGIFQCCRHLSGASINADIEIKSLDELNDIAMETNSDILIWNSFMLRMSNLFWTRDFSAVAELSERYSAKHDSALQQKRVLHVMRVFYEGIVYLNLARGPGNVQKKWGGMGEKAAQTISGYVTSMTKWNFENKSLLLQAELHYLNGDLELAETAYKASIESAHEHKFPSEEALSYELHGRFCVENKMAEKGSNQLRVAVSKYNEWGATNKANEVQLYLDSVLANPAWH